VSVCTAVVSRLSICSFAQSGQRRFPELSRSHTKDDREQLPPNPPSTARIYPLRFPSLLRFWFGFSRFDPSKKRVLRLTVTPSGSQPLLVD
jgi:hypothetical protein